MSSLYDLFFGSQPKSVPQAIGFGNIGGAVGQYATTGDVAPIQQAADERKRLNKVGDYLINDSIPAEMAKAAYRGFTLPGRVFTGETQMDVYDPSTGEMVPNPQVVGDAAELAGLVTLGAGAIPGDGLRAGATFIRQTDDVADRGAKIMSLLKSGRAKSITDDMLDMGDDVANARLSAWLYDNYDLPMDNKSRMSRADAMGFSATPTYHATHESFPSVDLKRADTGMSYGTGERAFWTTTQPKTADTYLGGQWVVDANGNEGAPIGDGVLRYYTRGAQIMPTLNKADNLDVWDMGGGAYPQGGLAKEIKSARRDKMDGVAFQRMKDQGIMGAGSGSASNTSIAAIKPNAVRSANARFDPRLAHLRNLTAGVAAFPFLPFSFEGEEERR